MKTVGEILAASAGYLEKTQAGRSRRLAEEILSRVLKIRRIELYMRFDQPVREEELAEARPLCKRVYDGEPIEYVLGEVQFFGAAIRVDRRALIPRQETEILADAAAKRIGSEPGVLWDVCTGSGCLGISLKKKCPQLKASLSDLSPEALALAKENAEKNGVDVDLRLGDLFAPFAGERADFAIINPPYVGVSEYFALDPSVRDFEPKMALVGGEKGTEFYERIAAELPPMLNPGAKVFLEIGSLQGEAVQNIFSSPVWARSELVKDWSGKDRFFFLEMQ